MFLRSESKKSSGQSLMTRLLAGFGLSRQAETVEEDDVRQKSDKRDNRRSSMLTDGELRMLTKNNSTPEKDKGRPRASFSSDDIKTIMEQIESSSKNVRDNQNRNSMLVEMSPEILKAKQLYKSSILAPNDLQADEVEVRVDAGELNLTEAQVGAVNNATTDFFNEIDLSGMLSRTIDDCLFGSGSHSFVLMPRKELRDMVDTVDKLKQIESGVSLEGVTVDLEDLTDFDKAIDTDCLSLDDLDIDQETMDAVVSTTKDLVASMRKKSGTNFSVTTDVRRLLSSHDKNKKLNDDTVRRFFSSRSGGMAMIGHSDYESDDDYPIMLEPPAHAVIPATMPGAPQTPVGFFMLTDQWNSPIQLTTDNSSEDALQKQNIEKAYRVMTGGPHRQQLDKLDAAKRWKAISSVFDLSIRSLMEKTTKSQGYEGLTFAQNTAVSNCILYNTLKDRKTKLVFIPEPMVAYFAIEYNSDGTGKTLLDDMRTILSMRAIWLVGRLMGEINNSVNEKEITLNFTEDVTDPEQIVSLFRKHNASKHSMDFTPASPGSIWNNLNDSGLSIMSNNMPGVEDFSVSKESTSGNRGSMDNEFPDIMKDLVITGLYVPAGALNEMNEAEFMRSVVSNNLFFANIIRHMQKPIVKGGTKFVRQFGVMSGALQACITKALKDVVDGEETNNSITPEVIAANLEIVLQPPKVSTMKAQFEDLDSYLRTVETIIEAKFNSDAVMVDDTEMKDTYRAIGERVKAQLIQKFLDETGKSVLQVPSLSDFLHDNMDDAAEFHAILKSFKDTLKTRMDKMKPSEGGDEEEDSGGGGGYGW